jgi:hypothetical protein
VSRRKRQRRRKGRTPPRLPADLGQVDWEALDWARIDQCLARFDAGSLAVMLAAAADSPGGGHRLPSLTVLWLRCLASPPVGTVSASSADLPRLLSAARAAAPQLRVLEDCWPADPRLLVRFPVAGQRFRVHPGSLLNPVLTLRSVAATAGAIDDFVLDRRGFRLTDLLEVALRYSDHRIGALASAWPDSGLALDRPDPPGEDLRARVRRIARTPVTVTDAEVSAAASADAESGEWIAACEYPDRAAAAWIWATRPAAAVEVDLYPGAERLGAVLAGGALGRDWPVPAALVVSAVAVAAALLAREATSDEQSVRRMQEVTERRALAAFGHPVAPAPVPDPEAPEAAGPLPLPEAPVAVIVPASRHAFVIGLASGLDRDSLDRSLRAAAAAAEEITPDIVQAADDTFDLSGSLCRVVIHGGPARGPALAHPGTAWVHVDDLIAAALDADQATTGESIGRDLLWQFLDELTSMPGVAELAAWDFTDIWELWLNTGVLNPGGRDGITLYPVGVPDQESWERSAAWEPLETVLTATGMPPSWDWQFARLDEPGQATVGQYGRVFLLLADPPLVLHVELEMNLASLGIDPAFPVGVAEGIRQTAQANPGVAAAMLAGDGTPLLCKLRLEAERSPDTPEDAIGCRLAAASGPPPVIELIFGADWLEYLAEDPAGGHTVLGRALAEGLQQALGLSGPATEAFLDRWSEAVPVAALRARETTLPPTFQGRDRLPRSAATAARARRAIAAGIVRSDVPLRCIYTGEAAVGLCTEVILPSADQALADAIAGWSPATLLAVARCLNDAYADRVRRATELSLALTAPWGPHWQATALDAPEPATITRPLELLLESLLARPAPGSVNADPFEIAEAADLASEAINASLYLHATRHRLHDLQIAVDEHGQFAITDTAPQQATTATIDIGAYLRADRADRLRLNPQPLTGTPVQLADSSRSQKQDFDRLKDLPLPGSLQTADAVLKQALRTGIDGIHAVLGTAVTWTSGADDVTEVTQAELREAAIAWSHLPPEQIDAALDLLILTPDQLHAEGLPYWEQERRTHRLATRPLIRTGTGCLLLIPRRIEATMDIYAAYFLDGRLPWPPNAVPRAVTDAFNNFRNKQNKELERHVFHLLEAAGIPFKGNIEPHHATPFGLRLIGEIDALTGDPARSRLWVCEVKDVSTAASPRTLASRVRKFTDPRRGYISKLLRSLSEVQANPGAAARLLSLPDPDRAWNVLPLMITRRVEPAAFTSNPAITFVVSEDLLATLQAPGDPPLGQAGEHQASHQ